jgi:hypothetical protein
MTKRGSWRELFYSIAGLIGILASIAIPVLIVTGVFEVVRGLSPANGFYRVVAWGIVWAVVCVVFAGGAIGLGYVRRVYEAQK